MECLWLGPVSGQLDLVANDGDFGEKENSILPSWKNSWTAPFWGLQ